MGDRRCCCLGCLIAEDKFTRDVGTLGANWDVLSGDFAIANDTIHCYHQSCAELSCSHAHADEPSEAMFRIPHREKATWEGSMHVLMRWSNEQYDQKYRIILNAVYNPDTQSLGNHYWAEYYSGTAVIDPTITLGKTSGGVESILATLPVLGLTYDPCDGRTFQAKIGSDGICANVTYGVQSFVWAMHEGMNATGRYSGMAVDETDPWHITHFQLYEHYDTNNDCDYCRCTCNGTPLPHSIDVTVVADGCLATLDGCTWTLEYDRDNTGWIYPLNSGWYECECCEFEILIECEAPQPGGFAQIKITINTRIDNLKHCLAGSTTNPRTIATGESTCDPLEIVVKETDGNPFQIGSLMTDCCAGLPPPAGTFYFVFTE